MKCSDVERNELHEKYILGRLDSKQQADYETHLKKCPNCRANLEMEKLLVSGIRLAGHDELRAEIEQQTARQDADTDTNWETILKIAAAVLFFIITPGLIYYYQTMSPQKIFGPTEISQKEDEVQKEDEALILFDSAAAGNAAYSAQTLPETAATSGYAVVELPPKKTEPVPSEQRTTQKIHSHPQPVAENTKKQILPKTGYADEEKTKSLQDSQVESLAVKANVSLANETTRLAEEELKKRQAPAKIYKRGESGKYDVDAGQTPHRKSFITEPINTNSLSNYKAVSRPQPLSNQNHTTKETASYEFVFNNKTLTVHINEIPERPPLQKNSDLPPYFFVKILKNDSSQTEMRWYIHRDIFKNNPSDIWLEMPEKSLLRFNVRPDSYYDIDCTQDSGKVVLIRK